MRVCEFLALSSSSFHTNGLKYCLPILTDHTLLILRPHIFPSSDPGNLTLLGSKDVLHTQGPELLSVHEKLYTVHIYSYHVSWNVHVIERPEVLHSRSFVHEIWQMSFFLYGCNLPINAEKVLLYLCLAYSF